MENKKCPTQVSMLKACYQHAYHNNFLNIHIICGYFSYILFGSPYSIWVNKIFRTSTLATKINLSIQQNFEFQASTKPFHNQKIFPPIFHHIYLQWSTTEAIIIIILMIIVSSTQLFNKNLINNCLKL